MPVSIVVEAGHTNRFTMRPANYWGSLDDYCDGRCF